MELEEGLELAKDDGVLNARTYQGLSAATIDVRKMLCGLRTVVLVAAARDKQNGPTGNERTGNSRLGSPPPDTGASP